MSSRHKLRRRPLDRTFAVMVLVTLLVFGLGLYAVTHLHDGNDPGHVCRPIPGTSRLDCG